MSQQDEDLDLAKDSYVEPSTMDIIKKKADELGITYRDNISEKTLENKVKARLAEIEAEEAEAEAEAAKAKGVAATTKVSVNESFEERKRSQLLHRVVVNPVDPRRTQLKGEMVWVGNSTIGFTGKYVPFNTEAGYHIPEIVLKDLQARTHTEFYTISDKDGNEHTKSRQRKSFIIEVLETIPQDQFDAIKARQLAQGDQG